MAQPSAAIRLDIDAMWMSATSSPIPRIRSAGGSDDQASTIRPNSALSAFAPGFHRCTACSTTPTTLSSADRSARLPDAATAAIASGCTNASEPSRVSNAVTSSSKASPCADPGPAHDASPIRWPSLRVRSKRPTEPAGTHARRRSDPAPSAGWRGTTRRRRGGTGTSAGRACPRRSRREACGASIRKSATPLLATSSGSA